MTLDDKNRLTAMRRAGRSYTEIAGALGISKNTVKTFCRRNGLTIEDPGNSPAGSADGAAGRVCLCCGKPVTQNPGRKVKKFCTDACRNRWWNSHLDQVKRKAMYEYTCPVCGDRFSAYGNAHRKYCSHACYITDRFGGGV